MKVQCKRKQKKNVDMDKKNMLIGVLTYYRK